MRGNRRRSVRRCHPYGLSSARHPFCHCCSFSGSCSAARKYSLLPRRPGLPTGSARRHKKSATQSLSLVWVNSLALRSLPPSQTISERFVHHFSAIRAQRWSTYFYLYWLTHGAPTFRSLVSTDCSSSLPLSRLSRLLRASTRLRAGRSCRGRTWEPRRDGRPAHGSAYTSLRLRILSSTVSPRRC